MSDEEKDEKNKKKNTISRTESDITVSKNSNEEKSTSGFDYEKARKGLVGWYCKKQQHNKQFAHSFSEYTHHVLTFNDCLLFQK